MLIEARPALDPELAALVAAQQRDGGPPVLDERALSFVAVVDGRAVACASWQPLPPGGEAELTRLYVRPAFRCRGIARQLIVTIEEEALAAGRPVLRATTCSPAAAALFLSSGYRRIADLGTSACFSRRLAELVQ
ncbi:GNAT family N-acetyltransferase [Actinoplanes sp. URMC 104]|uniref:GNAT family N-acetyltransferase n=1 Tax=Actinoplanes sp. URMC 104 TaxID=3423409 RepID=UPI003F19D0D2